MERQEMSETAKLFFSTKQEAVRLQMALKGFFGKRKSPACKEVESEKSGQREFELEKSDSGEEEQRESKPKKFNSEESELERTNCMAYEAYLKRRIRPAAAELFRQKEIGKIEELEERGWIDQKLLEELLETARKQGEYQAMIALLRIKDRKYGYQDHDFSI